jgi:cysteine desulfuration protein SufE
MSTPEQDIAALVDEFAFLDDWEDRYRHVIALGEALTPFPAAERTEANRVRGCVSQVWLVAQTTPGEPPRLTLFADSDAHIVRGLAAILMRIYSGRTPEEIGRIDAEGALKKLGLDAHLSPQRSNGLRAMVERIRALGAAAGARPGEKAAGAA